MCLHAMYIACKFVDRHCAFEIWQHRSSVDWDDRLLQALSFWLFYAYTSSFCCFCSGFHLVSSH